MGTYRLAAFEDFHVGQRVSFAKTIGEAEILAFVELCGDANPIHLDEEFARGTFFRGRIAHGMLTASLLSTAIGMLLPGTGAIYRSQTLEFLRPVRPGDTLTASLEVVALDPTANDITLDCRITRGPDAEAVLQGQAHVALIRARG